MFIYLFIFCLQYIITSISLINVIDIYNNKFKIPNKLKYYSNCFGGKLYLLMSTIYNEMDLLCTRGGIYPLKNKKESSN